MSPFLFFGKSPIWVWGWVLGFYASSLGETIMASAFTFFDRFLQVTPQLFKCRELFLKIRSSSQSLSDYSGMQTLFPEFLHFFVSSVARRTSPAGYFVLHWPQLELVVWTNFPLVLGSYWHTVKKAILSFRTCQFGILRIQANSGVIGVYFMHGLCKVKTFKSTCALWLWTSPPDDRCMLVSR